MARFLKGEAAIEHLKAGGTLWSVNGVGKSYWYWDTSSQKPVEVLLHSGATDQGLFDLSYEREVRPEPTALPDEDYDGDLQPICFGDALGLTEDGTEPPGPTRGGRAERKEQRHASPHIYAVGDIVTGDVAYRLVELGAKICNPCVPKTCAVSFGITDGAWDYMHDKWISHTRRTFWNPDADEWRVVEPPKTITAEEARKVVAAGGAVARTFVAPESEWVVKGTVLRNDQVRAYLDDGEWVVRRAAPEKASVLTVEESWALRRAEEGQELNRHERALIVKALRRLVEEMGK